MQLVETLVHSLLAAILDLGLLGDLLVELPVWMRCILVEEVIQISIHSFIDELITEANARYVHIDLINLVFSQGMNQVFE